MRLEWAFFNLLDRLLLKFLQNKATKTEYIKIKEIHLFKIINDFYRKKVFTEADI